MNRKRPIVLEAIASGLRSFRWVALGLFVIYFCSNITLVQPGEVALVLHLGRLEGGYAGRADQAARLTFGFPFSHRSRHSCAGKGRRRSSGRGTLEAFGRQRPEQRNHQSAGRGILSYR